LLAAWSVMTVAGKVSVDEGKSEGEPLGELRLADP
jgi:hypothetical protein